MFYKCRVPGAGLSALHVLVTHLILTVTLGGRCSLHSADEKT